MKKIDDDKIFCSESDVHQNTLRKRFLEICKITECVICGAKPEHNGKPLIFFFRS